MVLAMNDLHMYNTQASDLVVFGLGQIKHTAPEPQIYKSHDQQCISLCFVVYLVKHKGNTGWISILLTLVRSLALLQDLALFFLVAPVLARAY